MMYLIGIIGLLVFILFFSRSAALGKVLYGLAMRTECKLARLEECSVDIDDTNIFYYRSAEWDKNKPTLLLLHGFSADKKIWHRFAKHAKQDFNLLIPDLLGHGNTAYNREQSYSSYRQSEMLISFLTKLDIERYNVAGNSMGGMIAAILAKTDSDRVNKALLIDPAGASSDFAKAMSASGDNPFLHADINDFYRFYKNTMARPPFVPPCVLAYVGRKHYLERCEEFSHMFQDFFNIDEFFTQQLRVSENTLSIMWGDKDRLLPVSDAEVWEELSGVKPIIYKDIGHMPMVECSDICYRDCRAFMLKA